MNGWDYELYPNRNVVTSKCLEIQACLATSEDSRAAAIKDSRPNHCKIFSEVTPKEAPNFAGSYRGAEYSYLKGYRVFIAEREGTNPAYVDREMELFHNRLAKDLEQLNLLKKQPNIPEVQKTLILARLISKYIVVFLSIHPYANGNGHISRLIAWTLFNMHGFYIRNWDLDRRPEQPFDDYIALYQSNNKNAMAEYFLEILITENLQWKEES